MHTSLKFLTLTALLLMSVSACQLDDYLYIPYGSHELKEIDFTVQSFFRPEYYSGNGIVTANECEVYDDFGATNRPTTRFCFPDNEVFLNINRGLSYQLSYVEATDSGFVQRSSSGDFQYNDGFLLLDPGGGADRFRVDYTDDVLKLLGKFRQPSLIFRRE